MSFMATEPRFVGDVAMPQRDGTINFPGGALTAARGTLAAIFNESATVSACDAVNTSRSRKSYTRTEFIGATSRVVAATEWEEVRYPYLTKSIAKGGQPIKLIVQGEPWTARLSGNLSSLADFFCKQGDDGNLNGTVAFMSERGSFYGPYANAAE